MYYTSITYRDLKYFYIEERNNMFVEYIRRDRKNDNKYINNIKSYAFLNGFLSRKEAAIHCI